MIIESIEFLKDYKLFKKGELVHFPDKKNNDYLDLNVILLVGRNGSGKTTILGLISRLFHHIERYSEKIDADFILKYKIKYGEKIVPVVIIHEKNVIRLTFDSYNKVQLLPKKNSNILDKKVINLEEDFIEFSSFISYCPKSVVTSAFSLHAEYPNRRPVNFIGYMLLGNYNITDIYGKNHYKLGSISRGILRFIKLINNSDSGLSEVLQRFNLNFGFKVLVGGRGGNGDWELINNKWLKKMDSAVQHEEVYINDLLFFREGKEIYLDIMSAGEKMLLLRMISILNGIEDDSLVIIEEPELHLDQIWNKQLITFMECLFQSYNAQFLIATHDNTLINSVPKTNILRLGNKTGTTVQKNTFLASNSELMLALHEKSYGLNSVEEKILIKISDPESTKDELVELDKILGDSIYKFLLHKRLSEFE